jgi:hypothetical protein
MELNKIINQIRNHKNSSELNYDTTILEILNVLKKEEQHSNFIYWILTDVRNHDNRHLLLDRLITILNLPKRLLKQKPIEIKREKESFHGRVDIYIEWDNYKLLIENKVLSQEHDGQCKSYLSDYKINSKEDGKLIYLSLSGITPESFKKKQNDNRLIPLSYYELVVSLKYILAEINYNNYPQKEYTKYRQFIKDYITSVENILGVGMRHKKIEKIHDNTNLLFDNYKLLYDINNKEGAYYNALNETTEIIKLLVGKIHDEMQNIGITEYVPNRNRNHVFYKKNWKKTIKSGNEIIVGFSYEVGTKNKRLLPGYNHFFGLRVFYLGNKSTEKENTQKNINAILKEKIEEKGITITSKKNNWWVHILEENTNLKKGEKWDAWVERNVNLFKEMTTKIKPIIDKTLNKI